MSVRATCDVCAEGAKSCSARRCVYGAQRYVRLAEATSLSAPCCRRRWHSMMLEHPLDLAFGDFLNVQQADWLAATTVPLRSVSFEDDAYYIWDAHTTRGLPPTRLCGLQKHPADDSLRACWPALTLVLARAAPR